MERRTHLSEEVWASFNDTMDQFHKTMNEVDKTFQCAGATFSKVDRVFDESQKGRYRRLEIPLTLRNRFLLIRLAFSFAKKVRF